jgi:hypothetical protein
MMELIPLISLKKRKLWSGDSKASIYTNELIQNIKTDTPVYFLDQDGILNDKPNLCLYQKIGSKINLWIDSGPRELGDIVDIIMAGAQRITIRPSLWNSNNIENAKEITEQQIFIHHEEINKPLSLLNSDGIVLLNHTSIFKNNFKLESTLKTLSLKTNLYIYDSNWKTYLHWQKLGITGILIDFINYKEYINHVH